MPVAAIIQAVQLVAIEALECSLVSLPEAVCGLYEGVSVIAATPLTPMVLFQGLP